MNCHACGHENGGGAKFCVECGSPLARRCPSCGTAVSSTAKFCGECGTSLAVPPAPKPVPSRASAGERRHLTVMFCDLVGSTEISERLDPEDFHELLSDYQGAVARAIRRFDGHVAKYLGDGVVVFFGYPVAHEDDPCRAILAGLEILNEMARLNERRGTSLAVRVGIHTGHVIASEIGGQDDVTGETPNIAARLQEVAGPNNVVVSAATHRLSVGEFDFEPLGLKSLKGISRLMEVFRPLGRSAEAGPGRDPMVGRDAELDLLTERWRRTLEGSGQAVLLGGEAGIGKSRLMRAFRDRVEVAAIELACSPYEGGTPFHPVVKTLERALGLPTGVSPELARKAIADYLEARHVQVAGGVDLVASLLSFPIDPTGPIFGLSPEARRQRTLDLLLKLVIGRAAVEPVLLIVENIHWADPSTLELLGLMLEGIARVRAMTLFTLRPTFVSPWPVRANALSLTLDRLDTAPTRAIVERVAGGPLPSEVVAEILRKTDGVPLFVEELTKMVLESGMLERRDDAFLLSGPLPELAIPTTLQDSLMARLDRLSKVKDVVQLAAVLGREFSGTLIAAVADEDEAALALELRRLVGAEILFETRGADGALSYRFKHALLQDAAYESLLRTNRTAYHRRVAEVLEERFPEIAEERPELLALHRTAAGDAALAAIQWQRAGGRALARSANREAIAHFERGMEALLTLPEDPGRLGAELAAQANLGVARIAVEGFSSPAVERALSRAEAICGVLGESPQLAPVWSGLFAYHLVRADLTAARNVATNLVRLGEESGSRDVLAEGLYALGNVQFWAGEMSDAEASLRRAVQVWNVDPEAIDARRAHARLYGQDPAVTGLCYLGHALTFLGRSLEAIESDEEAIDLAYRIDHRHSVAWALGCAAQIRMWEGDVEATAIQAAAGANHAQEEASPFWSNVAVVQLGWVAFWRGDRAEGLAAMRRGKTVLDAVGSEILLPIYLCAIAEAELETGDRDAAAASVREGLEKTGKHGIASLEIDLLRMRARLESDAEAEATLNEALALAFRCHARGRALPIAVDLARRLRKEDRHERARQTLVDALEGWPEASETREYSAALTILSDESS